MLAFFIVYEQDGRTGNDFTPAKISPYQWLVEARKKYPRSYIALKSFTSESMPVPVFNQYQNLIGIEQDNAQVIKLKVADNKALKKPVIKEQDKGKVNGSSVNKAKGNHGKHNNPDK